LQSRQGQGDRLGDGSFQMNIQELQTMVHHQLPVKIFVWNNDGYLTIRATQNKLLGGRTIGTDKDNGTSFPNLSKIAYAYGIKHIAAKDENELAEKIKETLSFQAPIICEVICDSNQESLTSSSEVLPDGTIVSRPLEDMFPFLDRQEYKSNILPPPPTNLKK
jgi:acetolactate synthase-1/2/3 large subunit